MLKVSPWLEADQSKNSDSYQALRGKRPGDEVVEQRLARFNNSHMFADTEKEYMSRLERKTHAKGQPLQFFERYGDEGVAKVHTQMLADDLRTSKVGNQHTTKSA